MASVASQEGLDALITHTPRMHSLLEFDGGSVLEEDLSEYQMVQELRAARHGDGLFWTGGKPKFEVHYVNEDRQLDVMEGARWLQQKEDEYAPE